MKRRIELVQEFRALVDGKSKKSWGSVIKQAELSVGLLSPNDSHSILVSLTKGLKAPNRQFHPVRVAPLSLALMKRILVSDSPFRTKAMSFGFLPRLSIDWESHIPSDTRESVRSYHREMFKSTCEADFASHVDSQTLGYCAETAVFLDLRSEELVNVLKAKILNEAHCIPPLAIVQISRFLSHEKVDRKIWKSVALRISNDVGSFTAQNLVSLLGSFVNSGVTNFELIEKVCMTLSESSSKMRISDCACALNFISLLVTKSVSSYQLVKFSRSMQRRLSLILVSSHSPDPPRQISLAIAALERLSLPVMSPLQPLISVQPISVSLPR